MRQSIARASSPKGRAQAGEQPGERAAEPGAQARGDPAARAAGAPLRAAASCLCAEWSLHSKWLFDGHPALPAANVLLPLDSALVW